MIAGRVVVANLWIGTSATWREESPDTVVVGSQEPVTNTLQPLHSGFRVKGNAPGNARGRPRRLRCKAELLTSVGSVDLKLGAVRLSYGKCHREYTAGGAARWHRAGKPARRLRKSSGLYGPGKAESFGKGEKVG